MGRSVGAGSRDLRGGAYAPTIGCSLARTGKCHPVYLGANHALAGVRKRRRKAEYRVSAEAMILPREALKQTHTEIEEPSHHAAVFRSDAPPRSWELEGIMKNLTAWALVVALFSLPAAAQTKGKSPTAPGQSGVTPGQQQTAPGGAKDLAPGQQQTTPGGAKNIAPGSGQRK